MEIQLRDRVDGLILPWSEDPEADRPLVGLVLSKKHSAYEALLGVCGGTRTRYTKVVSLVLSPDELHGPATSHPAAIRTNDTRDVRRQSPGAPLFAERLTECSGIEPESV